MVNYYQLLEIDEQASSETIAAAYERQHERYRPERVDGLDDELREHAQRRTAELDRAYAVLIDPAQRHLYDAELSAQRTQPVGRVQRTGITRREVLMSAGGAVVGLLLIAVVWIFAGRSAEPALPPVGEVSRPAPDFALPGLNGGTIKLSDYRGKVVLVNFWGTWCEPCKEETPALQAAYTDLQSQGFEIIGVNLYSQETGGDKAVRAFLDPYGITYPIALDSAGDIARAFQISPIPTSYFVDPSGNIRFVKVGTLKAAEVRALFERLQARAAVQP
ncbi:MAG: redoxin domain-containing protein [Roseiflexaceae bacterium]|nr:redoxin domain-containing protein [Roseiflexaceae bacterium]